MKHLNLFLLSFLILSNFIPNLPTSLSLSLSLYLYIYIHIYIYIYIYIYVCEGQKFPSIMSTTDYSTPNISLTGWCSSEIGTPGPGSPCYFFCQQQKHWALSYLKMGIWLKKGKDTTLWSKIRNDTFILSQWFPTNFGLCPLWYYWCPCVIFHFYIFKILQQFMWRKLKRPWFLNKPHQNIACSTGRACPSCWELLF